MLPWTQLSTYCRNSKPHCFQSDQIACASFLLRAPTGLKLPKNSICDLVWQQNIRAVCGISDGPDTHTAGLLHEKNISPAYSIRTDCLQQHNSHSWFNHQSQTKTIVYTDTDTAADTNLDKPRCRLPHHANLIEKCGTPPYFPKPTKAWSKSKSAYRYRIGSGDVLNIMVWAHSDLNSPIQQSNPQTNQVSRGAWVDEGGYITSPLAGKIQAKGKTLDGAKYPDQPTETLHQNPQ